jgi:transketolase
MSARARSALVDAQTTVSLPEGFRGLVASAIKALSMDGVEQAKSGHPGMPMGAADMASALWTKFLVHDPNAPTWPDRDRFVLSAGHGSMLLYSLLHLSGYALPLGELKRFRQWGSKTPGHPEYGHTVGVEVTTGPLGSGFSAGVGLALAERFLAARYNREGLEVVDHFTYGIVSDGDLMEGVAAEAASFAGHQKLGKLVYLYDDNHISIDGATDLTFTEDVAGRFRAYGWQVLVVDGHDGAAIEAALAEARADLERPTLIACRTTIAHGAPHAAGTSHAHGAPLGAAEVAATKAAMGWPNEPFHVPDAVRTGFAALAELGAARRRAWEGTMAKYREVHPELAAELEGLWRGELPKGTLEAIPTFAPGGAVETRKAGQTILDALVAVHPTLLGGSADLAGSNGTVLKGAGSMSPALPSGRNVHFGVREHAMAGICNGLALHGGIQPFDATFLVFSDFMRGCLRLSALMELPVVHVLTHDSFFLGEDGPTHQPIEHLASLRAMPNLHVVRPADARETAGAWRHALTRRNGPTAIILTRQKVPTLATSREDVSQGAYVVHEPEGDGALHGILVATGSEVSLCLDAARKLAAEHGRRVRVVSMPCWEAFAAQPVAVQDEVLPREVTRRLSVEAGSTFGWHRWAAHQHGIDTFGASAPAEVLAERFGFTVDAVVERYLALG